MNLSRALATLLIVFSCAGAQAVGFQRISMPLPDQAPMEVGIWYPSTAAPVPLTLGPMSQTVAPGGALHGDDLPLIVMSHGSGGSFLSHHDTAVALAAAGYVVAALTHPGDNHADQGRVLQIMDRPRHLTLLIDYLLSGWPGHAQLDRSRIGVFGFSAGGFAALVNIGGIPDLSQVGPFCRGHVDHFACRLTAGAAAPPAQREAAADRRIKAAVIAAPALGFTFAPGGLKRVTVPVQLWRAENDSLLPHPWYAEAVRAALPRLPDHQLVPGAGHFDFLAPCSAAFAARVPEICTSAPGFDRVAFHSAFNAAVTAFFDLSLKR